MNEKILENNTKKWWKFERFLFFDFNFYWKSNISSELMKNRRKFFNFSRGWGSGGVGVSVYYKSLRFSYLANLLTYVFVEKSLCLEFKKKRQVLIFTRFYLLQFIKSPFGTKPSNICRVRGGYKTEGYARLIFLKGTNLNKFSSDFPKFFWNLSSSPVPPKFPCHAMPMGRSSDFGPINLCTSKGFQ